MKENFLSNEDAFVERIVSIVTEKIQPRLAGALWKSFNLTSPSTSTIETQNLKAPLHYDNVISKSDENDKYGKQKLVSITFLAG